MPIKVITEYVNERGIPKSGKEPRTGTPSNHHTRNPNGGLNQLEHDIAWHLEQGVREEENGEAFAGN